jgi:hypothetical protein
MWKEELKKVNKCPQRQDSVNDQLNDLRVIATKFGFYDAADFLKSLVGKEPCPDCFEMMDSKDLICKNPKCIRNMQL